MAEGKGLPPVDRTALAAYLRGQADQHLRAIDDRRRWRERLSWWRRLGGQADERAPDEFNRGAAINLSFLAHLIETGGEVRVLKGRA